MGADGEDPNGRGKGKGKGKKGKGKKGKGKAEGKAEDGEGGKGAKEPPSPPTELHVAARDGDIEKLKALLEAAEDEKAVNATDQHRRTPLHLAAFFGHALAVQLLLEKGADAQREAMDGFLALHFAAQQGRLDVVQAITRHLSGGKEHGVVKKHVNRVVHKGKKSALHLALQKNHVECAKFLVMKGASTEAKTAGGQSAIDLCQSDELRAALKGVKPDEEVAAAGDAVAADDGDDDSAAAGDEPPAKRRAAGEPGAQTAAADAAAAAPATVAAPDAAAAAAAAVPGIVEQPKPRAARLSTAASGLGAGAALSCGPVPLARVKVSASEGERSYPAGTAALADVNWDVAVEEDGSLTDGPVWCLVSQDVQSSSGEPTVSLSMQRSSYKLLLYTHFSDEGGMLAEDARCNACCLTLVAETSDGLLVLSRAEDGAAWQTWPASSVVTSSDVAGLVRAMLEEALGAAAAATAAAASARLLGVATAGSDACEGHRHELVVAVRLGPAAGELQKQKQGAPQLRFVRPLGSASGGDEGCSAVPIEVALGEAGGLAAGARRALLMSRG